MFKFGDGVLEKMVKRKKNKKENKKLKMTSSKKNCEKRK